MAAALAAGLEAARGRVLAAVRGGARPLPPVVAVLGNEACDLDSMVSSVAAAHWLAASRAASPLAAGASEAAADVVAVFNVPREELALRGEALEVLRGRGGVDPARCVLFREEFAELLEADAAGRAVSVFLVDHNRLSTADEARGVAARVCGVVDHHADERLVEPLGGGTRVVERVGSTCTLLAELLLRDGAPPLPRGLAHMLTCGVLLDTGNMSERLGVGTPRDAAALAALRAALGDEAPEDPAALAARLLELRQDVSGLTPAQLLLKDVKFARAGGRSVGISSVPRALGSFAPALAGGPLDDFCAARGLDVALVMAASGSGDAFARELLVHAPRDAALADALCARLEEAPLGLERAADGGNGAPGRSYAQRNAKASRKKVMPLVCEALAKL